MAPRKRARGAARGGAPRRGGRPRVESSPALSGAGSAVVSLPETPRQLSESPAPPTPPVLPPIRSVLLQDLPPAERALLERLPGQPPLLGRVPPGLHPLLERPSPIQSEVDAPLGRKRPASDQVSVTVASSAFLMRLQLTPTPVAKRTAALPPVLSCAVCLRCLKRIDKASLITKKGKGISLSAACVKVANRKCKYCAI